MRTAGSSRGRHSPAARQSVTAAGAPCSKCNQPADRGPKAKPICRSNMPRGARSAGLNRIVNIAHCVHGSKVIGNALAAKGTAQPPDPHIDRPFVDRAGVSAEHRYQACAAEDPIRISGKMGQQAKFAWTQNDCPVPPLRALGGKIDYQAAQFDTLGRIELGRHSYRRVLHGWLRSRTGPGSRMSWSSSHADSPMQSK